MLYKVKDSYKQLFCISQLQDINIVMEIEVLEPRFPFSLFCRKKVTYKANYDNIDLNKRGLSSEFIEDFIKKELLPAFKRYLEEEI